MIKPKIEQYFESLHRPTSQREMVDYLLKNGMATSDKSAKYNIRKYCNFYSQKTFVSDLLERQHILGDICFKVRDESQRKRRYQTT